MVRTRRFQLAVSAVVWLGTTPVLAQGAAPTKGAPPAQGTTPAKGTTPAQAVSPPKEPPPAQGTVATKTVAPAQDATPKGASPAQGTTATRTAAPTQGALPTKEVVAAQGAASAQETSAVQAKGAAQAPASESAKPVADRAAKPSAGTPEPQRPSQPVLAATRIRDGDALMRERRYREATFAFLDARHAAPDHVEARFKLGNALAVLGYYGRAIDEWETASRLTQDAAIRQSAQDNIARARAKQAEAGSSPQAQGQPPGSGPVADTTRAQARRAYEQGVQHISQRAYPAALQTLTQAIQQEPLLTVAYVARGSANIGLRRYAEAAADYQFALELEPDSASPLYGLAEAYRALGRNLEARDLYERYARSTATDVRPELQAESRQKADRLR
jgi:tetratricopeptide (TPR) repeat protein